MEMIILRFNGVVHSVVGNVPVDNEPSVVTSNMLIEASFAST